MTYFLKTTVTTEKFRSSCWIFSLKRFPKLDISDHLRIFDMNSIKDTFTSISRDHKMLYASLYDILEYWKYHITQMMRVKGHVFLKAILLVKYNFQEFLFHSLLL